MAQHGDVRHRSQAMLPEDPTERRRTRSGDPLISLARLFESTRRRAGIDAIVLADETGLTIAGAGAASTCDELAAQAALVSAAIPANDTVPCRLDVLSRAMEVRRLRIDGIEVFLCAEGALPGSHGELQSAAAGCERILGRKRTAAAVPSK